MAELRTNGYGVLPDFRLRELIADGLISGVTDTSVNPSSINVPISDEVYRISGSFLPRDSVFATGERIEDLLKSKTLGARSYDLAHALDCGVTYAIKTQAVLDLGGLYAYGDPRSTTGRNNLSSRFVVDNVPTYDRVPKGHKGALWYLVRPRSYPIKLSPGDELSQLRVFNRNTIMGRQQIQRVIKKTPLVREFNDPYHPRTSFSPIEDSGSIMLTLSFRADDGGAIGWEALNNSNVLEFNAKAKYDPRDFFRPVHARSEEVLFRKGFFYILSTEQRVVVPPWLSAELRSIEPRLGEFRIHDAGYIDAGWGWLYPGQGIGRPITLEFIPYEDVIIRPGQLVGEIRYECMSAEPQIHYDLLSTSGYINQSVAQLPRQFRA